MAVSDFGDDAVGGVSRSSAKMLLARRHHLGHAPAAEIEHLVNQLALGRLDLALVR